MTYRRRTVICWLLLLAAFLALVLGHGKAAVFSDGTAHAQALIDEEDSEENNSKEEDTEQNSKEAGTKEKDTEKETPEAGGQHLRHHEAGGAFLRLLVYIQSESGDGRTFLYRILCAAVQRHAERDLSRL